jgi:hypothetical protein
MPRDSIRRRRIRRNVVNGIGVGVFGAVLAWAITRQPATPSFAIHISGENAAGSAFANASESTGSALRKYPFVEGRYQLQEIADAALHDATRNVDIQLNLVFPKIGGKVPVIIFSPDTRESAACCEALTRDWASHGYAVVQLTRVAVADTEKRSNSVQTIRFKHPMRNGTSAAQAGVRALDMTTVIDSLTMLEMRFPEIRGKLDGAHIGVAGHAFGAVAAEAIAGALVDLPGQPRSNLADPRVRAVVCISPQGPGQSGLTEPSFDQLILPYLGVTSERDRAPGNYRAVAWHKAPFERSQPGDKYELFVHGDDPISLIGQQPVILGDSGGTAESTAPVMIQIRGATLAFWDAYLKHDLAARRYLRSDALQDTSAGAVALERR